MIAQGESARFVGEEGFKRLASVANPVRGPSVALILCRLKLLFEFLEYAQVVNRLRAAVHDFAGLQRDRSLLRVDGN